MHETKCFAVIIFVIFFSEIVIRQMMDFCNWNAHLLAHVHEKWGLSDFGQLTCLVNGANGIWASLCDEGAALGHACSTLTIMNLIRMGNVNVLEKYNCTALRESAQRVAEITTGQKPHHKKPVYGERALDLTFDFSGIAGGQLESLTFDFDMANFFGEQAPIRISTLSSEKMIVDRLTDLFGEDDLFAEDIANAMKATMLDDLRQNRKEDYMSSAGLALLYARSGGKLTPRMSDIVNQEEESKGYHQTLINAVHAIWDEWNLNPEAEGGFLKFEAFYNGFMAPYFGCFSCEDTQRGLKAIDLDKSGKVDWGEFLVYLKWALRAFPDIADCDELLSVTFRKGLIPVMSNVVLGRSDQAKSMTKRVTRQFKPNDQRKNIGIVRPLEREPKFIDGKDKPRKHSGSVTNVNPLARLHNQDEKSFNDPSTKNKTSEESQRKNFVIIRPLELDPNFIEERNNEESQSLSANPFNPRNTIHNKPKFGCWDLQMVRFNFQLLIHTKLRQLHKNDASK